MSFANYNHRIGEILKYEKIFRQIDNIEELEKIMEYFRWEKTNFKDTGVSAEDLRVQYENLIKRINDKIDSLAILHKKNIEKKSRNRGRKALPKYESFESMFENNKAPQEVIKVLIDYETLNPQCELIKPLYEVIAITEALKILGIIKSNVSKTNRNSLFAKKVNVKIGDKTTRSKSKNYDSLLTEYKELFSSIVKI